MTEAEWDSCTDPIAMLQTPVRDGYDPGERKLLLFDCACGRRIWEHLTGPYRRLVEVGELAADGLAAEGMLERAAEEAAASGSIVSPASRMSPEVAFYLRNSLFAFIAYRLRGKPELVAHAALLRDLFGPLPFRPLAIAASWRTPEVLTLARQAAEDRLLPEGTLAPARLGVLAAALEAAGCTDAELLGHLRGPGPHVRGCWALDVVVGKQQAGVAAAGGTGLASTEPLA
jgi:hypothetical protein